MRGKSATAPAPRASGHVSRFEYDRGRLELRVWLGATERPRTYRGVPPGLHEALLRTPEKTRFFETYIRENYDSDR